MELAAVARFGILLVRPGALMMVGPGLGGQQVPPQVRIALTVLLGLLLAPSVTIPSGPSVGIVAVVIREVAIGLALGLAARAVIAGAELAGHICSQQIGFSYAATIDPEGGARNTALASLYGLLATFTWLMIGGHHLLIRALDASYTGLPIGGGGIDASLVGSVRDVLAVVFVTGVRLAAPLVAVLMLVEVAVGLISRSAPALNFFVIGYPVRLIVGLFVVALSIATLPGVVRSLAERVITMGLAMARAFL
ncbi:MAG TPA: flagellar biosynthetic protein FliR [Vicinamibacterales bacterium]